MSTTRRDNPGESAGTGLCPRCGEVLDRYEPFGVSLYQCPRCHGMWFEAAELERIIDEMDDGVRWKDIDLRAYADRAAFHPTSLRCPTCGGALSEIRFDTSAIELEFCARCGGAWLEKGKLADIVNYLRQQVAQEPLEQIEKEALHQFVEIFTGHKGPWGEAKDFVAALRLLGARFMIDHPVLAARLEIARRSLPF